MVKKSHQTTERVAAALFGIIGLVHALRLAYGIPVVVGEMQVPLWLSGIGLVIAAVFAVLLWKNASE